MLAWGGGRRGGTYWPCPSEAPAPTGPGPASSGNPRKFRHGIYLVYTWYILLAFVILVYTRYMTGICFLGKSIFVYH
jgi:hypothetical protein